MQRAPLVQRPLLNVCVALCAMWSSAVLAQAAPAPAAAPPAPVLPAEPGPRADQAPASSAQATPGLPASERESLIEEGVRLRQEARDEQALATFQRAAALGRDGRVLAQIAFAEQAMGRWSDSYLHLKEALADSENPWVRERAGMLQEELKKIEANVGRLEVRTNVAVSKLTIDGKSVDVSHLTEPFIVPTGSVVVSAEAPGYLPTTRHVPVYAGSLSRTELVLVNEPTITPRVSQSEARVSRNPVWLYVAGAGALASIASVGPWRRGENLTNDLKKNCAQPDQCSDRYDDDTKKVNRLDAATNALLFGGVSVAALSTAAYFLFPRREQRTTVSAWVLPSSFGLAARGSY